MKFDREGYLESKGRKVFIVKAKKRDGINPKQPFDGYIHIGEIVFPAYAIGERIKVKIEVINK